MANKLGGNPSSGGWKPPSGDQHPPFKGGKTSSIGGSHDAGPMAPCPPANQTQTSSQSNAVERTTPAAVVKR